MDKRLRRGDAFINDSIILVNTLSLYLSIYPLLSLRGLNFTFLSFRVYTFVPRETGIIAPAAAPHKMVDAVDSIYL